jgi:hypothetical protein
MSEAMQGAVAELKAAVERVKAATGEDFIFAGVEYGAYYGTVEYSVYRKKQHKGSTLEEAVDRAIHFNSKAENLEKANRLRQEAARLEAEAQ